MLLAAFFVEPDPEAAVLPVDVGHGHAEGRADAGEGKDQETDQSRVAQAYCCRGVDTVEQLARFGRRQYRGVPTKNSETD